MKDLDDKFSCIRWALLVLTDKGWREEGIYTDEEEAEYYLEEYKEELPECTCKVTKVDIKENE